ncbi:MAG: UvrD-helicase domain-containing protein [Treponema sp.]|jgi:DNA helicase-2/ATP-dependent DNA helicase PcrA|nr:UvrD-helicase domain-containing protein [Treponema sp.]
MAKADFSVELNGPQLEAVTALEGPVLIIAGAGSGKTRVITYRIARMLERGIPQQAILALTFTNKAAHEMERRVRELSPGKPLRNLTVSTFHAFGVRILREDIEALGGPEQDPGEAVRPRYRKNFSIYDETDRTELIKESLRECRVSTEGVDLYKLGQLFSDVKTGRLRWGEGANSEFRHIYEEYQYGLQVYNALDFDDLLVLPIKLFEENPGVLEKYHRRYRYIMVDEFQDTSLIQYRLLRMLAWGTAEPKQASALAGAAVPNVCVVGDDDQSIYSWRGANYENLLMFEQDFPGVLEIKLEQNYRSTTTILEAANGVISNNSNRKEKTLWSGNSGGKPVEFFQSDTEREEAESIAGNIHRMRFREGRAWGDFGILVRTNSLMETIEEALLAENIPYRVSGGTSFFQRKEIKDLLSYLRVVANPRDDVNLLRIINTPRRGIGKTAITRISETARKNHSSIWEALERLNYARRHAGGQSSLFGAEDQEKNELEAFMALIESQRSLMLGSGSLSAKVRDLVDKIDYWSYLVSEFRKNEKTAKWKYLNIERLIQAIQDWEKDEDTGDSGLYAYLNRVSLITRDDGDDEAGKGKVNLMTIHAAKGLEFPVVFIAGAEEGIIPHERSLEAGEGSIEEERRLFYVAITRARDKLSISSCRRRKRFRPGQNAPAEGITETAPSPFLAEIPPHLLEYGKEENDDELEEAEALELTGRMMRTFGLTESS